MAEHGGDGAWGGEAAAAPRRLVAATDGSCLGNPGPGGWAWVVADAGGEVVAWAAGGERSTTNNRMELRALAELLDAADRVGVAVAEVRVDSRYVVDAVSSWAPGWRRRGWVTARGAPVANRDLVEPLLARVEAAPVTLRWVRGHAGEPLNEAADTAAHAAAEAVRRGDAVDVGGGADALAAATRGRR